jgi:hypothetical protein
VIAQYGGDPRVLASALALAGTVSIVDFVRRRRDEEG